MVNKIKNDKAGREDDIVVKLINGNANLIVEVH